MTAHRSDTKTFLSPSDCRALLKRVETLCSGGGEVAISLSSTVRGVAKWARSQLYLNAEIHDVTVTIIRTIRGAQGAASTNRLDDDGLRETVRGAERAVRGTTESPGEQRHAPAPPDPMVEPTLWSDTTFQYTAEARSEMARSIMQPAEAAGLLAAGTLQIAAEGVAYVSSDGSFRYYPVTDVQCSMTVRDKRGTGSGWAGRHDYDLRKIDMAALAHRAVDKCLRSQNPVAVEPGRYTAILEPQAVADLLAPLPEWRPEQEHIEFMRWKSRWAKIGDLVIDRRLTLSSDPMDPEAGYIPFDRWGTVHQAVKWIDRGVLRDLSYVREDALRKLGRTTPLPNPLSWRLSGGGPITSIEDMMTSTKRGILVTRFTSVQLVSGRQMLLTGYTRDGLWLIEDGKIAKPIKNFRFTESILFALNNVEAIGPSERVFRPPYSRAAPALKIRDFGFSGLADSV